MPRSAWQAGAPGLGKERREAGYHLSHGVSTPRQRPIDRVPSAWPFLVERYAEAELEGHVHFRLASVRHRPARDFCAVFRKGRQLERAEVVSQARRGGCLPVGDAPNRGPHNVQEAVFVGVVELVEEPEGMELGALLIPSLVGLQVLDDCLGVIADADDFGDPVPSIVGATPEDWELRTALIRRRIAPRMNARWSSPDRRLWRMSPISTPHSRAGGRFLISTRTRRSPVFGSESGNGR